MADVADGPLDRTFLGHPRGLFVLFFAEMWERFSFYGMRALLIFYLTQHFLFGDGEAAGIYASYGALVYLMPVIGGLIADRFLGFRKAVVFGALLLCVGHFGMALEGAPAERCEPERPLPVALREALASQGIDGLFRRHEIGRAHHRTGQCQLPGLDCLLVLLDRGLAARRRIAKQAGQTKVENLDDGASIHAVLRIHQH